MVNSNTDMLENIVSNNDPTHGIFHIELICRSSIRDNNPKIFSDEQEIADFLQSQVTNKGLVFNDKQHGAHL